MSASIQSRWILNSTTPRKSDRVSDLFVYQFSRDRVEAGDFSHFLGSYGLDALPKGRPLAALMNAFTFVVDGYNDHPDELHSIPAVRAFYGTFHRAWPYWLYFCNLDNEGLRMMVLCCLKTLSAVKVAGSAACRVSFEPIELIRFLGADFPPMNEISERAGLSEMDIYLRSKAVFEYFDLPYHAPPP